MPSIRQAVHDWLRWSEKYTKIDMVYITKGGFWLTLGNGIASLTALFSSILFAHFVSKETFGTYQYILSIAGLLAIATLPEISDAMMRAVSKGKEGEFAKSLRARIYTGFLGTLAGIGIAAYYYQQGNTTLAIAFVIVAVFTPFTEPLAFFIEYLKAKTLFKEATFYKIFLKIFPLAGLAVVIWKWPNLFAILGSYFLVRTLAHLFFHRSAIKKHPPNQQEEPGTTRFGVELTLISSLKTIIGYLDKILIFHYLGAAEVALYYFATAPIAQIRSGLGSIKELAYPKYSIRSETLIRSTLWSKFWRLELFILIPSVLAYIFIAPYIFPWLFPQYSDAIGLSIIYSVSLIFFPRVLLNSILVAKKKGTALWISQTLSPLLRLAVLIPAVKFFGLTGIVVGTIIVNGIDFTLNLIAVYWPSRVKTDA